MTMDADACRKSVDSLKHEIDALERLTRDESSSMAAILSKATQAVAAQQSVTIGLALQQAGSAAAHAPAAITTTPAKQQQRRPAPPPAHSARPLSYTRRDGGAASPATLEEHHRAGSSSNTARSNTMTPSGAAAASSNIRDALLAEGWDSGAITAALRATHGVSRDAAEGWLASMPGSSHNRRPTSLVGSSTSPQPQQQHVPPSLRQQETHQQRQTLVAGGSAVRAARLIQPRGVLHPKPAVTVASPRATAAALAPMPLEPALTTSTSHNVAPQAVSESRQLPETEIWKAPVVVACSPGSSSPLRRAGPTSTASVEIQVRGPEGTTSKIGKAFRPHDSLKTVVMEYLRVHPMHPMPCFSSFRVVVPWLRKSYAAHVLEGVTLADASLCPTATIVLQVENYNRRT